MNVHSLQAIMLAIAEARSLDPILEQIVRGVAEASDLALVRLWLLQQDRDCPLCASGQPSPSHGSSLHLRGSVGHSRKSDEDYSDLGGQFHRIKVGERKIGEIAQSGKPMLIPEVTGIEPWIADREWMDREGVISFAGQPLVFRGETLGVLAVFSRTKLSPEEFNWLRTFADHAAIAIANARAFDELENLKRQLEAENEYLHGEIRQAYQFGEIIGHSPALQKVLEQVTLVADTAATVMIQGESGTGKELIARAIHERSPRRTRPFIKVNCGAIPKELFESEFFGHVKGAFTGAVKNRVGRFELADTGDLFLDEIAEIPLSLQTKLLRVLQEKQFERVGDAKTHSVDVRVICATNRDLKQEVAEGRFREDLFYRLSVFPIDLPPLRDRKEDIGHLALSFIKKSASKLGIEPPGLTRNNLRELQDYDWPGNIRELEHVIERATILSRNSGRLAFDLTRQRLRPGKQVASYPLTTSDPAHILKQNELKQHETENIMAALQQSKGKVFGPGGAAELLQMRPTTLASRIKALGLKKTFLPPGNAPT